MRRGKYGVVGRGPIPMEMNADYMVADEMMAGNSIVMRKGDLPELKQTLRTFFPETWLWDIQTSE